MIYDVINEGESKMIFLDCLPILTPDYSAILQYKVNKTRFDWLPSQIMGEKVDAYLSFETYIASY